MCTTAVACTFWLQLVAAAALFLVFLVPGVQGGGAGDTLPAPTGVREALLLDSICSIKQCLRQMLLAF